MNTVKIIEDEFGSFEDEVLNAGWMPPQAEPAPVEQHLQKDAASQATDELVFDTDAFLNLVYRNQQ